MVTGSKIDYKRELRRLYTCPAEPVMVDVPDLAYLMIDGHGDPNTAAEYRLAIEALYAVAYAAKFAVKRTAQIDYAVMPLEGLWWTVDMARFTVDDKSAWDWTMMIMQPVEVTPDLVEQARVKAALKRPPETVARVRLDHLTEGHAAQILHTGPYAAEGPTIQRLHAFIAQHGYELTGKHHEIYLSDPRRSAPERMKTIVRQPITAAR